MAEYCSMKLPSFIKELDSFKSGDFEQALKDAFIGFDSTLLEDKVIEELRHLARKNPDYEDSDMDEDDETAEEIINLHQEATMPLAEVLEKYKGNAEKIAKIQTVQRLLNLAPKQKGEVAEASGGPSSSSIAGGSGGSSSTKASGSGSVPKKSASDNEVSSSSSKPVEADTAEPSSSSGATEAAPDSTHTIPVSNSDKPEQSTTASSAAAVEKPADASANGLISGSEYKIHQQKSSDDEAISSSSTQENGESASSCPSSSLQTTVAGGSSGGSSSSSSSPVGKATKVPNHISSSSLPDTESDSSSDDENDVTYKDSQGAKPLNSDDDTTDEEVDQDDEELDEEEEMSGEEDEEDDCFDDDFMNNMETGPGKASGCTAVVALMTGRDLYVANAGDSRCVVCRAGKVVEMSFDHKPEDDIEFERIRKAGGRVTLDGRVNGGLNLSRAIGDHGYKMNKELPAEDQMISALPDIKRIPLEPEDEFMVLACDGIWNYMSNEEVVGYVKQRIDAGKLTLAQICEEVRKIKLNCSI